MYFNYPDFATGDSLTKKTISETHWSLILLWKQSKLPMILKEVEVICWAIIIGLGKDYKLVEVSVLRFT
jgi:hypothetical protein